MEHENKMNKLVLVTGAVFGLFTVIIGAFGAHALSDILELNDKTDVFETAVTYQSIHALVLLFLGLLSEKIDSRWLHRSVVMFVVGVLIFSGSLYLLSLTNMTKLGMVTPIGGVFMILGWVFLLIGIMKSFRKR